MKPYVLFAGDVYYPFGGWEDFVCWLDEVPTMERARELVVAESGEDADWVQVVELATGVIKLTSGE